MFSQSGHNMVSASDAFPYPTSVMPHQALDCPQCGHSTTYQMSSGVAMDQFHNNNGSNPVHVAFVDQNQNHSQVKFQNQHPNVRDDSIGQHNKRCQPPSYNHVNPNSNHPHTVADCSQHTSANGVSSMVPHTGFEVGEKVFQQQQNSVRASSAHVNHSAHSSLPVTPRQQTKRTITIDSAQTQTTPLAELMPNLLGNSANSTQKHVTYLDSEENHNNKPFCHRNEDQFRNSALPHSSLKKSKQTEVVAVKNNPETVTTGQKPLPVVFGNKSKAETSQYSRNNSTRGRLSNIPQPKLTQIAKSGSKSNSVAFKQQHQKPLIVNQQRRIVSGPSSNRFKGSKGRVAKSGSHRNLAGDQRHGDYNRNDEEAENDEKDMVIATRTEDDFVLEDDLISSTQSIVWNIGHVKAMIHEIRDVATVTRDADLDRIVIDLEFAIKDIFRQEVSKVNLENDKQNLIRENETLKRKVKQMELKLKEQTSRMKDQHIYKEYKQTSERLRIEADELLSSLEILNTRYSNLEKELNSSAVERERLNRENQSLALQLCQKDTEAIQARHIWIQTETQLKDELSMQNETLHSVQISSDKLSTKLTQREEELTRCQATVRAIQQNLNAFLRGSPTQLSSSGQPSDPGWKPLVAPRTVVPTSCAPSTGQESSWRQMDPGDAATYSSTQMLHKILSMLTPPTAPGDLSVVNEEGEEDEKSFKENDRHPDATNVDTPSWSAALNPSSPRHSSHLSEASSWVPPSPANTNPCYLPPARARSNASTSSASVSATTDDGSEVGSRKSGRDSDSSSHSKALTRENLRAFDKQQQMQQMLKAQETNRPSSSLSATNQSESTSHSKVKPKTLQPTSRPKFSDSHSSSPYVPVNKEHNRRKIVSRIKSPPKAVDGKERKLCRAEKVSTSSCKSTSSETISVSIKLSGAGSNSKVESNCNTDDTSSESEESSSNDSSSDEPAKFKIYLNHSNAEHRNAVDFGEHNIPHFNDNNANASFTPRLNHHIVSTADANKDKKPPPKPSSSILTKDALDKLNDCKGEAKWLPDGADNRGSLSEHRGGAMSVGGSSCISAASSVSTLRSRDDRQFKSGLAKLDAQIERLQSALRASNK